MHLQKHRPTRRQLLQRLRDKRKLRGVPGTNDNHLKVGFLFALKFEHFLIVLSADGDADVVRQDVRLVKPLVGVEDN